MKLGILRFICKPYCSLLFQVLRIPSRKERWDLREQPHIMVGWWSEQSWNRIRPLIATFKYLVHSERISKYNINAISKSRMIIFEKGYCKRRNNLGEHLQKLSNVRKAQYWITVGYQSRWNQNTTGAIKLTSIVMPCGLVFLLFCEEWLSFCGWGKAPTLAYGMVEELRPQKGPCCEKCVPDFPSP
jgi:hypothetical protein